MILLNVKMGRRLGAPKSWSLRLPALCSYRHAAGRTAGDQKSVSEVANKELAALYIVLACLVYLPRRNKREIDTPSFLTASPSPRSCQSLAYHHTSSARSHYDLSGNTLSTSVSLHVRLEQTW